MKSIFFEKNRKLFFYLSLFLSFISILIFNFLTPYMSDDLLFDTSVPYSLWDLIKEEYSNYMTWNGRVILQFIMHACLFLPKWIFNILNSLCFILLTVFIYLNIEHRKKYDYALFILINLLIWQFGIDFSQTILWVSGSCNYLWGMTIILGYITLYQYQLAHAEEHKKKIATAILMLLTGFIAGWCNENTSGGAILLILMFTLQYYFKNKKIKSWMYSGISGMAMGLTMMVMAPGNRVRSSLMQTDEEHSGLLAILSRFLRINEVISEQFFLLIIAIVLLIIYFQLKNSKEIQLFHVYAFLITAAATSYVLIVTPKTMDRAHFGSNIFIIIALVQLIAYIPKEDLYLSTLKYGCIVTLAVHMFFTYCDSGADLMRIQREVRERDHYILAQKEQGKLDLIVPQLRPEFQNKYSFIYSNDVTEDPDGWGNRLYREYYKLDQVIGVPRTEWNEY